MIINMLNNVHNKSQWSVRLTCLVGLVILLTLVSIPERAYAEWPPFKFRLKPSHNNGRITYQVNFTSKVDGLMNDIILKIPLPVGTRFVEAGAEPSIQVDFDGSEVTFFTATSQRIREAYFIVEVTDPTVTVFTTHAWLAWKGDVSGDYLTEDVSIDITEQPLPWEEPERARVELAASATVADNTITYAIYPANTTSRRVLDLKVNVPIPEGTTLLSLEAPPDFVANYSAQEVYFSTLALEPDARIDPLIFEVSTQEVDDPYIVTYAWATWKNEGRRVGRSIVFQEETRSSDLIVQPHASQRVISDMVGDVPFANYDVSSLALGQEGLNLKIVFYTLGELGPVGEPLLYDFFLDSDCCTETGKLENERGAEYRIRYRHNRGQTDLDRWDEVQENWNEVETAEATSMAMGNRVTMLVPIDLLNNAQQFCWTAEVRNRTPGFNPNPPTEKVPDGETAWQVTAYELLPVGAKIRSATAESFGEALAYTGNLADLLPQSQPEVKVSMPPATPAGAVTKIGGKLAVPLDNGRGFYDVHIFSFPAGQELVQIPYARQPNFHLEGQRLLINREGGGFENVYEYNLADGTQRQVSDAPRDSHPFYDPWGNRVVYGNPELTVGLAAPMRDHHDKVVKDENGETVYLDPHRPFIFVQCGLQPPHLEKEPRCYDMPGQGVLVPAGQMNDLQGTHPVWTANDMIAYKGCNSWAGFADCGIYIVSSTSTKGFSDGFIPRQLTDDTSDIPTDTKGNLIAFMSHREGNWEVYVMDLNGTGVRNLSNAPDSADGLPTISPDGNWLAFTSNRGGRWAIWAVSIAGGPAQKLFDLPEGILWGNGDRDWTNERISWGP